jgi:hypothetical protein
VGGVNCSRAIEGGEYSHASLYVHDHPWDLTKLGAGGAAWAVAINNAGQIAANGGYAFKFDDSGAMLITCVP